ncbi:hypothetical protein TRFO_06740 [Tritrichomonas foetus]|uniref:Uncharacterized protein n=1 Tax=Tritrichomonas foetus TaxID=1144522 RepID=A0A1J4JWU5_9EUKA|nr:hypothetical protein TRFO_06740 [Tritrichomonas foetus]|eukprot:OHT03475.1 hypothetical protein TRFO_06740 [Tritrichomonas foetus]
MLYQKSCTFKKAKYSILNMSISGFNKTNSIDRDEIIDDMQAKIGELLKVNQDLCTAKNQIEVLKDQLIQQQKEFQIEKTSLQQEIEICQKKISQNEGHISELQIENENLSLENSNLKEQYQNLEEKFAKFQKDSIESKKSEIEQTQKSFLEQSNAKDSHIAQLNAEIKELKDKNENSSDVIEEQTSKINELKDEKEINEKKIETLNQEKSQINNELSNSKKAQEKIEKELEVSLENEKKLSSEVEVLSRQNSQLEVELSTKTNKIEEIQKILGVYQSIEPKIKSPEELKAVIIKRAQIFDALKHKYQKLHKNHLITLRQFREQAQAIEGAANDLSDVQENALNMQKQIEEDQDIISKLKLRNEKLEFIKTLNKTMIKANTLLMKRVSTIEVTVNPDNETPSFRSLMIAFIMAKRWKGLIGFENKAYEKDPRNWWWLVPTKSLFDSTIAKINAQFELCESLKNEISQQNEEISNLHEKEKTNLLDMEHIKEQISIKCQESQSMQEEIENLKNQVESMVNREDLEIVVQKYQELKERYKTTKGIVIQQNESIEALSEQVQKLEQEKKVQHNRLKLSARSNEQIKQRLTTAHDQIGQLQVELDYKERAHLALERHINRGQIIESRLISNCMSLANQNNREIIYMKPDFQKCQDGDIKSKLTEMSENLVTNVY